MFQHRASALALSALVLLTSAPASAKKSEKSAADPAFQSKALSIFMTYVPALVDLDVEKGFAVPTYVFNEAAGKYELKETKFAPASARAFPDLAANGLATTTVLLTSLEPNYETAKDADSVSGMYPMLARVVNEAAGKIFGHSFIAKYQAEKSGSGFFMYDPKTFRAAFDKLYFKPTETRGGVVAQKLYDAVFKQAIADEAELIAKVTEKKDFQARAKDLLKKAQSDENFHGGQFAYQAAVEMNGGQIKDGEPTAEPLVGPRLVGTLLRRQADGTLPVILQSLKTVLKDYDPDTFKKVGSKL